MSWELSKGLGPAWTIIGLRWGLRLGLGILTLYRIELRWSIWGGSGIMLEGGPHLGLNNGQTFVESLKKN